MARVKLFTITDLDMSTLLSLNKKWHSSENKTFFPSCTDQDLCFFAYANLFFIIFWCNSWFFVGFLAFQPVSISQCLTVAELTCTPEYTKPFCNSKLLFRGYFLLFLRTIASSFGMVLRFLPHLPLRLGTTKPISACCHIIRDTDFWLTSTILAMALYV